MVGGETPFAAMDDLQVKRLGLIVLLLGDVQLCQIVLGEQDVAPN